MSEEDIFKKNLKDYYDNLPDRLPDTVDKERLQPFTEMPTFTSFYEGRRLFREGQDQGAISSCTRVINGDPTLRDAYRIRAAAYRRLGQEQEAETDIEHLINKGWYAIDDKIPWVIWTGYGAETLFIPNVPLKTYAIEINSYTIISIRSKPMIPLAHLTGFKLKSRLKQASAEEIRKLSGKAMTKDLLDKIIQEYFPCAILEYFTEDETLKSINISLMTSSPTQSIGVS